MAAREENDTGEAPDATGADFKAGKQQFG